MVDVQDWDPCRNEQIRDLQLTNYPSLMVTSLLFTVEFSLSLINLFVIYCR